MSFAADDTESIARRLKEIEAEKQLALTGSTLPIDDKAAEKSDTYDYGYGMASGWRASNFNYGY